ncbi:putative mitogen-activated protein kinase kinase kinase [Helianthus annuus]|nr:putative mitogen-activated protein kinase kinase kinase [Helianthus annuus]
MLSFKGSPYWMAPEVVMNTSGYSLAVPSRHSGKMTFDPWYEVPQVKLHPLEPQDHGSFD